MSYFKNTLAFNGTGKYLLLWEESTLKKAHVQ